MIRLCCCAQLRETHKEGRYQCRRGEVSAPKVPDDEMVIVQDVPDLLTKLAHSRLRVPAMIALFTGMRIGEVLALRRNRVDLAGRIIQIREALEQTKAHGIRFKAPKSKAGRSGPFRVPNRQVLERWNARNGGTLGTAER